MDGATPMQAFRRVILPLAMPGVFTAGILAFIAAWNDFLFANVLTATEHGADRAGGAVVLHGRIAVPAAGGRDRRRRGDRHRPDSDHGADLPAPHRLRPHRRRGQGLKEQGAMADIVLDKVDQALSRRLRGRQGAQPRDRRRRVHDPRRPVGLRQVDRAEHDRGARGHLGRRAADRRQGRQPRRAARPRHRDGVPELRAVSAHDRPREHGVRAASSRRRPKAEIDRKVQEAADILDLTEHLERKPANLSGGQRQRVAMGRAIVRDPKAFLMDEPLSNLDAKLRVQMRAEVARIQRKLEHDDRLRHPRSDRGDDAGRPRGGDAAAACCSRSARRWSSTTTRRTCSSPASSALPA